MRCTRINEISGKSKGKWDSTYLCIPQDSPYILEFSNNGPISSSCGRCLNMNCGSFTPEWANNFLCFKCRTCTRGNLIILKMNYTIICSKLLIKTTDEFPKFCVEFVQS